MPKLHLQNLLSLKDMIEAIEVTEEIEKIEEIGKIEEIEEKEGIEGIEEKEGIEIVIDQRRNTMKTMKTMELDSCDLKRRDLTSKMLLLKRLNLKKNKRLDPLQGLNYLQIQRATRKPWLKCRIKKKLSEWKRKSRLNCKEKKKIKRLALNKEKKENTRNQIMQQINLK